MEIDLNSESNVNSNNNISLNYLESCGVFPLNIDAALRFSAGIRVVYIGLAIGDYSQLVYILLFTYAASQKLNWTLLKIVTRGRSALILLNSVVVREGTKGFRVR
jgi:hypothetical protein